MDRELLERYLRQGLSLPQIGAFVGRDPSTVGYWVKKHGLKAVGSNRFAPKRSDLSRRQLKALVDEGASLREISTELALSMSTVRYWLQKHGLRTYRTGRRRKLGLEAKQAGLTEVVMRCRQHGFTTFSLKKDGVWRCKRCNRDGVVRWRRRVKQMLVEEAGGRCRLCGYGRYQGALHFHHLDPTEKSFVISRKGATRSMAEARREAAKCVLLCANCHAEVEAGIAMLT